MKSAAILAAAVLFATGAHAQDMKGHDNGTGGAGAMGAGRLSGTSSIGGDSYHTAIRLIHHEKYSDAIPYIDAALNERPDNANVLAYAGYAHGMVGDRNLAIDYLRQSVAKDPDNKMAHQYLGEALLAVQDVTAANGQLGELARLCPNGCDEKDALTKAIAGQQASAAPAAKQP